MMFALYMMYIVPNIGLRDDLDYNNIITLSQGEVKEKFSMESVTEFWPMCRRAQ